MPVPKDATLNIMEGTNFTFQCKIGLEEEIWNTYKQLKISYKWEVKLGNYLDTQKTTLIWRTIFNQQRVTHHSAEDNYSDRVLSSKNDISSLMDSSFISLLNVEINDPMLTYDSTQMELRCSVRYWYNGSSWHSDSIKATPLYLDIDDRTDIVIVGKCIRDYVFSPFRYVFYTKSSGHYQAVIH